MEEVEMFYPKSQQEWREWLLENHEREKSVWLLFYKSNSAKPSISWSQAVDEALCFGWIDSKKKKRDHESFIQFFSQRKAQSTWSKINKDKVQTFIEQGLMAKAGFKSIEIAKQNGSWSYLDEVEALIVPQDLQQAFNKNMEAQAFYESLSKSDKKSILYWLLSAKRLETRQKRIHEVIAKATKNVNPNPFK